MKRYYLRLLELAFRVGPEVLPLFQEPTQTWGIRLDYKKNPQVIKDLWKQYIAWRETYNPSEKLDSIIDSKENYEIVELIDCEFVFNRFYNIYYNKDKNPFSISTCHPRWSIAHRYYSFLYPSRTKLSPNNVLVILGHENSKTNYFHFLLEIIGAVLLAREIGVQFGTIASYDFKKTWQVEIKNALSRQFKIDWVALEATTVYQSSKLLVAPRPVGHSSFSLTLTDVYDQLYNGLIQNGDNLSSLNSRIFISREDATSRKIEGIEALWTHLELLGFTRVICSDYTVGEQAQIFRTAKIIVAEHGAALANLVFCVAGTRVIEIFADYLTIMYAKLAAARGVEYQYFIAKTSFDLCDFKSTFPHFSSKAASK